MKEAKPAKEVKKKSQRALNPDGTPKPKKTASAYLLYLADIRAKIKEENHGISNTDLMKKGAEMWGKLTAEEKAPFEEKAKQLKVGLLSLI